ncbi:hypothetical protein [Parasitella parasitica]|uniref:Uncharacterized protein n=1 Tax=Parasitella parasitica TaxID=35722 RepID=A0A0B7NBB2_9FUNG|nr:hypothetical protein [Parasitella parasitica]
MRGGVGFNGSKIAELSNSKAGSEDCSYSTSKYVPQPTSKPSIQDTQYLFFLCHLFLLAPKEYLVPSNTGR